MEQKRKVPGSARSRRSASVAGLAAVAAKKPCREKPGPDRLQSLPDVPFLFMIHEQIECHRLFMPSASEVQLTSASPQYQIIKCLSSLVVDLVLGPCSFVSRVIV
jgi:hypothetical protein